MSPFNRAARLVLLGLGYALATTDGAAAAVGPDATDAALLARLTHTRAIFVRRAGEEGYRVCPPPAIRLGDSDSLGHFEADGNTVHLGTWARLRAPERERFESLAGHTGGARSAQALFEEGVYRWVFVHELGHWWQSCRHAARPHTYGAEAGANRIALAFWREHDAQFLARTLADLRYLHAAIASPVPQHTPKEQYLDEHFRAIAQSPAYAWYQADMILELTAEVPPPSFHKALSQPLYPW